MENFGEIRSAVQNKDRVTLLAELMKFNGDREFIMKYIEDHWGALPTSAWQIDGQEVINGTLLNLWNPDNKSVRGYLDIGCSIYLVRTIEDPHRALTLASVKLIKEVTDSVYRPYVGEGGPLLVDELIKLKELYGTGYNHELQMPWNAIPKHATFDGLFLRAVSTTLPDGCVWAMATAVKKLKECDQLYTGYAMRVEAEL